MTSVTDAFETVSADRPLQRFAHPLLRHRHTMVGRP
jgi:hypothetical protein